MYMYIHNMPTPGHLALVATSIERCAELAPTCRCLKVGLKVVTAVVKLLYMYIHTE